MPLLLYMCRALDELQGYLHSHGYTDPLRNADQLSMLLFFYFIESIDNRNLQRAKQLRKSYVSIFAGKWPLKKPDNAHRKSAHTIHKDGFRCSRWSKTPDGAQLLQFVRDEVLPFYAETAALFKLEVMQEAKLRISDPAVLTHVVRVLSTFHLDTADTETFGDLCDYLFKYIGRRVKQSPGTMYRSVYRAMVEMVNPVVGETIYDPVAGCAGVLLAGYEYMRLANSFKGSVYEVEIDDEHIVRGTGDRLSMMQAETLVRDTFYGNDANKEIARLANINLVLHGLPGVHVSSLDIFTSIFDAEVRESHGMPKIGFDVILSNPLFPQFFIDRDGIDHQRNAYTAFQETLCITHTLNCLRKIGRSAVIVTDDFLLGLSDDSKMLCRELVEHYRIDAVLSLPTCIFPPFSEIKTSVLIFHRSGKTEQILFLTVDEDKDVKMRNQLAGLVNVYKIYSDLWQKNDHFSIPITDIVRPIGVEWSENWKIIALEEVIGSNYIMSAEHYH